MYATAIIRIEPHTRPEQAFRPGVVDLTEDQLAVNRNAITLPTNLDLDILLPDFNW